MNGMVDDLLTPDLVGADPNKLLLPRTSLPNHRVEDEAWKNTNAHGPRRDDSRVGMLLVWVRAVNKAVPSLSVVAVAVAVSRPR